MFVIANTNVNIRRKLHKICNLSGHFLLPKSCSTHTKCNNYRSFTVNQKWSNDKKNLNDK